MQWSPRDALPAAISSAVYSCDGLLVYAGFCDGAVGVFEADGLRLRCRIAPTAYISSSISRYADFVVIGCLNFCITTVCVSIYDSEKDIPRIAKWICDPQNVQRHWFAC